MHELRQREGDVALTTEDHRVTRPVSRQILRGHSERASASSM